MDMGLDRQALKEESQQQAVTHRLAGAGLGNGACRARHEPLSVKVTSLTTKRFGRVAAIADACVFT